MEDAHAAVLDYAGESGTPTANDKRLAFFGVYDGHGGDKVALYTGDNLHQIVAKQEAFKTGDLKKALQDGFLATDRAILSGTSRTRAPPRLGKHGADSSEQTPNTKRKSLAARPRSVSSQKTKSTWYVGLSRRQKCVQRSRDQANAGDSRTVLGVKGRAKPLSFDHKPQNEGE